MHSQLSPFVGFACPFEMGSKKDTVNTANYYVVSESWNHESYVVTIQKSSSQLVPRPRVLKCD